MSATAHGSRAGTKTTKITKITKTKWLFVVFVAFVIFVLERAPSAVWQQPPPTQAQPLSENENQKTVTVELPLAPFARGVYSIEVTAGARSAVERRRLTFTIK